MVRRLAVMNKLCQGGEGRRKLPHWGVLERTAQACHDPLLDHRHTPSLATMPQYPSSTAIKHTVLSIIQQPERNVGRRMHLSTEWGGGHSVV